MARQRKTDKYRLKEGRGTGRGTNYNSWIKVHEFASRARAHRILGWRIRRPYQLMSDLEYYYFLIMQWQNNVIDIREQYPLLPIEQTKQIADNFGIKHPAKFNDEDIVMTTDFLITVKKDNLIYDVARTIKYAKDLKDKRVKEKFKIEKEYWRLKKIDWGVITEMQISKIFAQNISYIYNDYYWAEENCVGEKKIKELVNIFKYTLNHNSNDILKTINAFDKLMGWSAGEGLNFFKYMLAKKIISTDMYKKLNFHTMKIEFK